jgi:hypothetical protein
LDEHAPSIETVNSQTTRIIPVQHVTWPSARFPS